MGIKFDRQETPGNLERRDLSDRPVRSTEIASNPLSHMGQLALLLVTGACATLGLEKEKGERPSQEEVHALSDPRLKSAIVRIQPLLRPDEYVIPNEVFDTYKNLVDSRQGFLKGVSSGGYISRDRLEATGTVKQFRTALTEKGLPENQIDLYERLLRSADTIVFAERVFIRDFILTAIPHERFHKEMKRLSSADYEYMKKVADEIRHIPGPGGAGSFLKEKVPQGGFLSMAAQTGSFEEFYAYMADGAWTEEVEQKLAEQSPRAYRMYLRIKEQTRLDRSEHSLR